VPLVVAGIPLDEIGGYNSTDYCSHYLEEEIDALADRVAIVDRVGNCGESQRN